jgi:hypothetical protein
MAIWFILGITLAWVLILLIKRRIDCGHWRGPGNRRGEAQPIEFRDRRRRERPTLPPGETPPDEV